MNRFLARTPIAGGSRIRLATSLNELLISNQAIA